MTTCVGQAWTGPLRPCFPGFGGLSARGELPRRGVVATQLAAVMCASATGWPSTAFQVPSQLITPAGGIKPDAALCAPPHHQRTPPGVLTVLPPYLYAVQSDFRPRGDLQRGTAGNLLDAAPSQAQREGTSLRSGITATYRWPLPWRPESEGAAFSHSHRGRQGVA